ncbi:hypothetical protein [Staphylococcus aureus]|nr:hypothetical protein [Staphylococcus aureus]
MGTSPRMTFIKHKS